MGPKEEYHIDFIKIREVCPRAYAMFKLFLAKYEFGNPCWTWLEANERYKLEMGYEVNAFIGWLDKFFIGNSIIVNTLNEWDNGLLYYTEVIDWRENLDPIYKSIRSRSRLRTLIEGYTAAFGMLEKHADEYPKKCSGCEVLIEHIWEYEIHQCPPKEK